MLGSRSEAIQAVFGLVAMAAIAGVVVGTTAAEMDGQLFGYGVLALGIGLGAVLVGRVTERVLAAGEVPGLGVGVDAPDNATTGFYAGALAVVVVGLVVEVTVGEPDPLFVVLFLAAIPLFFSQGFRRGTDGTTGE